MTQQGYDWQTLFENQGGGTTGGPTTAPGGSGGFDLSALGGEGTGGKKITGTTVQNGWGFWVYSDGSTSPMTGEQMAAAGITGGSKAPDLDQLVGTAVLDATTGNYGILKKTGINVEGQPDVYWLADEQGNAIGRVDPGSNLIDPVTRNSLSVGEDNATTSTKLSDGDIERLFGTGSGTTGSTPQPFGYTAPDPVGAASVIANKYDALVQNGTLSWEAAVKEWEREWNVVKANMDAEATNIGNQLDADIASGGLLRDYTQMGQTRAANIADSQLGLRNAANEQANLERLILESSVPMGTQVNLGPFGMAPSHEININDVLNRGLPSIAEQYSGLDTLFPAIGEAPVINAGTVNPIDPSQLPNVPGLQLPDPNQLNIMDILAGQAAAGSQPLGWTGGAAQGGGGFPY